MGETIRTALLRKVFREDDSRRQFDAKLARICVLFEDLRIEIRGISERSLPALDVLDPEEDNWINPASTGKYRSFYFLRRSLVTLCEFAEALRLIVADINNDAKLNPNFRVLTSEGIEAWHAAVRFFDENEAVLNRIRNDIGGHFGHRAALNAVSMLGLAAYGSIASTLGDTGVANQLKLHFALEIAGTALLQHLPNRDIRQYEALVTDCIGPAYDHAMRCVYILVREYLWDRFG